MHKAENNVCCAFKDYCSNQKKGSAITGKSDRFRSQFPFLLHSLYDADLIDEDAIWKWVEEAREDAAASEFVKMSDSFLQWLKSAEEEDEAED